MGNLANIPITDHFGSKDYIILIQDGCARRLTIEQFMSELSFGGSSICEAWQNCNEGIGCLGSVIPETDTPPTIQDLIYDIPNRKQDNITTFNDFKALYYDEDGDALQRVVVAGGDTGGFTINGSPVNLGDSIIEGDVLKYIPKDQDSAYQNILFFRAYDINNIEAQ